MNDIKGILFFLISGMMLTQQAVFTSAKLYLLGFTLKYFLTLIFLFFIIFLSSTTNVSPYFLKLFNSAPSCNENVKQL